MLYVHHVIEYASDNSADLGQCRKAAEHASVGTEALEVDSQDRGQAVERELLGGLHSAPLAGLAVVPLIRLQLLHLCEGIQALLRSSQHCPDRQMFFFWHDGRQKIFFGMKAAACKAVLERCFPKKVLKESRTR